MEYRKQCNICETGSYWASIDKLVYGSGQTDAEPPRLGRC